MLTEKRNTLSSLIESTGGVHLSAYLVYRGDTEDLRAQLAETLKIATENITPVMTRIDRSQFLKPLRALLEDTRVLETLRGNVGIFRTAQSFRVLHVPVPVEQACMVATTFHVKPLLRWIQSDRDFFLVGLDQETVHLYQGSQHTLKLIDTLSLSREIAYDTSLSSKLNFWNSVSVKSQEIEEIVLWLEDKLALYSKKSKPKLFFAGKKKSIDILGFELSYGNIAKYPLTYTFSAKNLSKITAEIRTVLTKDAESYLERSFLEFKYANNLDLTETNIFEIAKAAIQGRVKKLMIAGEVNVFGKLNPTNGDLVLHEGDRDHEDDCLLDDLAQTVLAKGGNVIVASKEELPGGHSILAITEAVDPERSVWRARPSVSQQNSNTKRGLL